MMTWNIAKNPWGKKTHPHTHTSTYSGIEQLICGSSYGIRVGKRVEVCKQVEPGRHVFGSPRGSCIYTHIFIHFISLLHSSHTWISNIFSKYQVIKVTVQSLNWQLCENASKAMDAYDT